jgi:bacterioferritin (cytochrome b1)
MEKKVIDRYNIVISYCDNQTDEQWKDMLFKALVYESLGRSAEEKVKIANVLEIIK